MANLESLFDFNQTDLNLNRNQQISASQRKHLETAFRENFRQNSLEIFGYFGLMVIFSIIMVVFVDDSWEFILGVLMMWAAWTSVFWHHIFGKHNLSYLYQRLQVIRQQTPLLTIEHIQQADYDFRNQNALPADEAHFGDIYYDHQYYSHWIKTYTWYKESELSNYDNWYRLQSDAVEMYITNFQYQALEPNKYYDFHCFVDSHNVAYVLSVVEK